MRKFISENFYVQIPSRFNIAGFTTLEIDRESTSTRVLAIVSALVGIFNFALVGILAIFGINLLFPSAKLEYTIINLVAINLIRYALLKIDKDD